MIQLLSLFQPGATAVDQLPFFSLVADGKPQPRVTGQWGVITRGPFRSPRSKRPIPRRVKWATSVPQKVSLTETCSVLGALEAGRTEVNLSDPLVDPQRGGVLDPGSQPVLAHSHACATVRARTPRCARAHPRTDMHSRTCGCADAHGRAHTHNAHKWVRAYTSRVIPFDI